MRNYKQWTPAQRWRNLKLYREAVALGLIEEPKVCRGCRQDKGIIHMHCVNYDVSLAYLPKLINGTISAEERGKLNNTLVPVCWRCHMMLHKKDHHPQSYEKYFAEIRSGIQYPPVYKPDAWYELDRHIID